ncbi:Eukaryotic translation initiation factor 3 subunit 10 [Sinorhizobium sojae CCBAU 05684]|uniref:Eukaryotic translation initiation factor 3 subunit 10 n=1 Tax=Sinorhizobium sojae CCBAU 05684 TaxID=716928 RepID=A0A249PDR4_9HYPH|nr:Eukaryotic translation initiation factor 3 subunit 10 [Sinorhizobium sojae CCBAU 05684]
MTRTYDSSGPDVKIRGTAQHIAEKYAALARDAQSAGDRVMAENYLQHAEHYNRIIAAAQAQMQDRFQRDDRQDHQDRDPTDREQDDLDQDQAFAEPAPVAETPASEPQSVVDGSGPQPVIEGVPAEVALEEETQSGRASSRRRSASRPRRPRRNASEEGATGETPAGESAAMAASE